MDWYSSRKYQQMLEDYGIRGRKRDPHDELYLR